MTTSPTLRSSLAPTGTLRVAINVGNPILAKRDPATGTAAGVSVDLATELARRLQVDLQLLVCDAALQSVDKVAAAEADAGFFAIDPERDAYIEFTAPYVLIEGCYLVRADSPIESNDAVDRPQHRIAVGKGSAYDLFLSREIKQAAIVRAPTSPAVVQTFVDQGLEVAAGVKQQLESEARRLGGLRLLPARFMVIRQAMGLPKNRGRAAADYLRAFVEDMKSSGFVAAALVRHGIVGASVAAPASPGE